MRLLVREVALHPAGWCQRNGVLPSVESKYYAENGRFGSSFCLHFCTHNESTIISLPIVCDKSQMHRNACSYRTMPSRCCTLSKAKMELLSRMQEIRTNQPLSSQLSTAQNWMLWHQGASTVTRSLQCVVPWPRARVAGWRLQYLKRPPLPEHLTPSKL